MAFNAAAYALGDCSDDLRVAVLHVDEHFVVTQISRGQIFCDSKRFAQALAKLGVVKGERVFLYLPRIPEVFSLFYGVLRSGAIAGTLFAGFSQGALYDRLHDAEASVLVTTAELYENIALIRDRLPYLQHVIIITADAKIDDTLPYSDLMKVDLDSFPEVVTDHNDTAFMLYTSGTTGKPKGIVHRHGAVLQNCATFEHLFSPHSKDIYWCSADHGWITGISYVLLAPIHARVPTVFYQGRYNAEHWFQIIQSLKVSLWYTAPTALRLLMQKKELFRTFDLSSLRFIASVGEPLNPEVIEWSESSLGLSIHDTWFQTELGSISISNHPSLPIRQGSMGHPLPGISAEIIDDHGSVLPPNTEGHLALKPTFTSVMSTIWKNPEKHASYFSSDWYLSGDRARKDEDGYIWFIGRADDIITTSGERVGPFEVESALLEHPAVVEAGVIGKPDAVYGEIIKAFVVLQDEIVASDELIADLIGFVKETLSKHAAPREIAFVQSLPKTRSGKIMRRILKARELGLPEGDQSTLEEM